MGLKLVVIVIGMEMAVLIKHAQILLKSLIMNVIAYSINVQ